MDGKIVYQAVPEFIGRNVPVSVVAKVMGKDEKQSLRAYAKDIERKTAERMIRLGELPLEKIATCVPSISLDELKEIEAEVMQLS